MNPYVSITLRTFTIWVMAAMINGILTGIYVEISKNDFIRIIPVIFGCGIVSLLFSIPGFIIFWIVMLVAINNNIYGRSLFRRALSAAFILSATTGIIGCLLILKTFSPGGTYVFPFFIIFSAITSTMMHFNHFKKIGLEAYNENK